MYRNATAAAKSFKSCAGTAKGKDSSNNLVPTWMESELVEPETSVVRNSAECNEQQLVDSFLSVTFVLSAIMVVCCCVIICII